MGRNKEMERTCQRCDSVWYLPIKEARAKAPNRMRMSGARMMAAGSTMSMGSKSQAADQMRVSRLEAAKERADRASQCPNCGSSKFKERVVK